MAQPILLVGARDGRLRQAQGCGKPRGDRSRRIWSRVTKLSLLTWLVPGNAHDFCMVELTRYGCPDCSLQCVVLAVDEFRISMLGVSLDWLLAILDL
jgi:hypothetical protein